MGMVAESFIFLLAWSWHTAHLLLSVVCPFEHSLEELWKFLNHKVIAPEDSWSACHAHILNAPRRMKVQRRKKEKCQDSTHAFYLFGLMSSVSRFL